MKKRNQNEKRLFCMTVKDNPGDRCGRTNTNTMPHGHSTRERGMGEVQQSQVGVPAGGIYEKNQRQSSKSMDQPPSPSVVERGNTLVCKTNGKFLAGTNRSHLVI